MRSNDTLLRDQGVLILEIGHRSAAGVGHALAPKREASASMDEALKTVGSAIRMHSASIGVTVADAVKSAITPVVTELETLKKSTAAQDSTLAEQDKKLDQIVRSRRRLPPPSATRICFATSHPDPGDSAESGSLGGRR